MGWFTNALLTVQDFFKEKDAAEVAADEIMKGVIANQKVVENGVVTNIQVEFDAELKFTMRNQVADRLRNTPKLSLTAILGTEEYGPNTINRMRSEVSKAVQKMRAAPRKIYEPVVIDNTEASYRGVVSTTGKETTKVYSFESSVRLTADDLKADRSYGVEKKTPFAELVQSCAPATTAKPKVLSSSRKVGQGRRRDNNLAKMLAGNPQVSGPVYADKSPPGNKATQKGKAR